MESVELLYGENMIDHTNTYGYKKYSKGKDKKDTCFLRKKHNEKYSEKNGLKEKKLRKPQIRKVKNGGPKNIQENETLYYGLHTCEAIIKKRCGDIVKIYLTQALLPLFSNFLKYYRRQKKVYHVVENKDLEKLSGSLHHENIVMVTKRIKAGSLKDLEEDVKKNTLSPILWLDRVQNPHNIGTILRIMAHFGWRYMVETTEKFSELTPAMARLSEGGCEYVKRYQVSSQTIFMEWAKKNGYRVIGTSSRAGKSVYEYFFPQKTIFVLGQEGGGVSEKLLSLVDENLFIPGTGHVESLNVSVAAGVFLGEYVRQRGIGK